MTGFPTMSRAGHRAESHDTLAGPGLASLSRICLAVLDPSVQPGIVSHRGPEMGNSASTPR